MLGLGLIFSCYRESFSYLYTQRETPTLAYHLVYSSFYPYYFQFITRNDISNTNANLSTILY